jgi:hypothetical protein
MSDLQNFKPEEFCSSKLWEIVCADADAEGARAELEAAVAELANRRHYLAELAQLDESLHLPTGN